MKLSARNQLKRKTAYAIIKATSAMIVVD